MNSTASSRFMARCSFSVLDNKQQHNMSWPARLSECFMLNTTTAIIELKYKHTSLCHCFHCMYYFSEIREDRKLGLPFSFHLDVFSCWTLSFVPCKECLEERGQAVFCDTAQCAQQLWIKSVMVRAPVQPQDLRQHIYKHPMYSTIVGRFNG